jgi:diacylglycerol kinase family enzyme
LNEVINRAPGVPVAVLPLGNENLVAKHFDLSPSIDRLAEAIEAGSIRNIDLGRARDRFFSLMAGAGIDAAIVHRVHHSRHSHISKRTYAWPTLKSLASYSFPLIDVEISDSGERLRGATVFVFNMPRYGLGLPIALQARPDDGRLDLWVFQRPGAGNFIRYLAAILGRRHDDLGDVQHRLVHRVRLWSDAQVPLQVDGDPAGHLPVVMEIAPNALGLVTPAPLSPTSGERGGG